MRVVVLSDNRATEAGFETEHGLSVYLETERYKCLLDVGASDLFARNGRRLNIDLSDVDYLLFRTDIPITWADCRFFRDK